MDSAPASDGDLARAAARGDAAAEAAIFERFAARVRFLARRELRSGDLADEACSETFVRVLQALRGDRLRSPDALAAFVLQTTRHVVREMMRARARSAVVVGSTAELPEPPADPPIDTDVAEAVRAAVRGLSPRDRQYLRLQYYDELPRDEIAHRLGIAPERLRLIKSRALRRVRLALEASKRR